MRYRGYTIISITLHFAICNYRATHETPRDLSAITLTNHISRQKQGEKRSEKEKTNVAWMHGRESSPVYNGLHYIEQIQRQQVNRSMSKDIRRFARRSRDYHLDFHLIDSNRFDLIFLLSAFLPTYTCTCKFQSTRRENIVLQLFLFRNINFANLVRSNKKTKFLQN